LVGVRRGNIDIIQILVVKDKPIPERYGILGLSPGRYLPLGTAAIRTRTTNSYLTLILISHLLGQTLPATSTFFQGNQAVMR